MQVILVGTDIPGLSTDIMTAALAALDASQLVLGPAIDGGFYLIGVTAVPEALMSVSRLSGSGIAPKKCVHPVVWLEGLRCVARDCLFTTRNTGSQDPVLLCC